jgi:hypothetical protein
MRPFTEKDLLRQLIRENIKRELIYEGLIFLILQHLLFPD